MCETIQTCKVWSSFEGKRKDGKFVKLRFQELPLARAEEAIQLNSNYMLRDELCHRASGAYKNKEAVEEYKSIVDQVFQISPPHVTICCVDDGSENGGEMAGVSIVMLTKKTDSLSELLKMFEVKTREIQILLKTAHALELVSDLSQQCESHYHGRGVVVHPDYRGMGVANEFVRLRKLICQEHNIPMSSAWMTAKGTQRAADKHKWETHVELEPRDLAEKTGLVFEEDAIVMKLMYVKKD